MKSDIKILIVDDYMHSRVIISHLLREQGYTSITVVDQGAAALEAIRLLGEQTFDLIIMDMLMPVMDGYQAIKAIRELPAYKVTPIIALLAFSMQRDEDKCKKIGANACILKPIDSKKFYAAVELQTGMCDNTP